MGNVDVPHSLNQGRRGDAIRDNFKEASKRLLRHIIYVKYRITIQFSILRWSHLFFRNSTALRLIRCEESEHTYVKRAIMLSAGDTLGLTTSLRIISKHKKKLPLIFNRKSTALKKQNSTSHFLLNSNRSIRKISKNVRRVPQRSSHQ